MKHVWYPDFQIFYKKGYHDNSFLKFVDFISWIRIKKILIGYPITPIWFLFLSIIQTVVTDMCVLKQRRDIFHKPNTYTLFPT